MIKFLLVFLLAIFLFFVVAVGIIVSLLYNRFRGVFKMFKGNKGNDFSNGQFSNNSNAGQGDRRTTVGDAGETIIDRRDPQKAGRKIIPHDEGEYVDFKE